MSVEHLHDLSTPPESAYHAMGATDRLLVRRSSTNGTQELLPLAMLVPMADPSPGTRRPHTVHSLELMVAFSHSGLVSEVQQVA